MDTWLGAVGHRATANRLADIALENGYPSLDRTLLGNVLPEGLTDRVVPLPLDSASTTELMHLGSLTADIIHLDAGHEEASAAADLRA